MKVLLIFLGVAATAWADNCNDDFGKYLNNLKDEITKDDNTARDLEVENRDDYHKLVKQCFLDDESNCHLAESELQGDIYGEDGPMKGCERCQKMARGLRDKYMGSKEDVRKCFRKHLGDAIREELQPCIQGKISNGYDFTVPPIPDFDEKTFKNIDIAETANNYRIWARSRLDACKTVHPDRYATTNLCMEKGYAGIFSKHCQAAKNAKDKAVQSKCSGRFAEVKKATCQCMDEKRESWHDKFDKIKVTVDSTRDNTLSASQCGVQINDVVGAWVSKLQNALNDCLPKDSTSSPQKTDLHTLIDLGCGQVYNGGVKGNELTTGFRFIRLFLDALNDRITMYCDKNCNF